MAKKQPAADTAAKSSEYVAVDRITDTPGDVLAMPGDTCDSVPQVDLAWLLEYGHIKARES